jgi:hypothetical protein
MRKWPPAIWPLISVGSVFILMGSAGNRTLFIIGVALMLVAFGIALFLALGRRTGPRPAGVYWVLGGFATIYVVAAVVGGATLGWAYAVAAILAGVIPLTAFALIIATVRAKTEESPDGLSDTTAERDDDPFPGMGLDNATPLGDSPELSDASTERGRSRNRA